MTNTDKNRVMVLAVVEGGMSVTEAATRLNLSPASCGRNARFADVRPGAHVGAVIT
jgi:hypothetical protein